MEILANTYSTIEPNKDLIAGKGILRWEEPEVQLVLLVCILRNGQKPSVRFANVKGDIWNRGAIDNEFWEQS